MLIFGPNWAQNTILLREIDNETGVLGFYGSTPKLGFQVSGMTRGWGMI